MPALAESEAPTRAPMLVAPAPAAPDAEPVSDPDAPTPEAQLAERCVNAHALGQEARLEQRLSAARASFESCANPSCPALVRADCETWAAEVQAAAPKVIFELGSHLAPREVTVWVNGQVTEVPFGRPVTYDPGPLALRVEAPGREPMIRTLTLEAGQPVTTFPIQLALLPASPRAEAGPNRDAGLEESPAAPAVNLLPHALGTLAIVSAAVGTYFAVRGLEQQRDGLRSCAPLCPSNEVDTVRRNLIVADVSFGVSALSAAAAIVLALSPGTDGEVSGSRLSVHADADSLLLRGSF